MRRRIIREKVVQALYAYEIGHDPVDYVIECILTPLKEDKSAYEFARRLVVLTIEHTEELDEVIGTKITNWDYGRIATLDRLILRMAICEFRYFKEIPAKVTVNEAIELAKLFSTSHSGQFVNGVLDSVLIEMKAAGSLPKSGRGLYEGKPSRPSRSSLKNS